MSIVLAPSILSADFGRLAETVERLNGCDCDWIHVDVMDGRFVPPITFGAQLVRDIRTVSKKPLDCHLMVDEPDHQVELFAEAGADRITIHVEATQHLHRLLQRIRALGVSAGVAINPATPVASVEHVLGLVDLVLVMTVNPGWGGQRFLDECLPKIEEARRLAPSHWIEVDGGMDLVTAARAVSAGANAIVAGSYTFDGDPAERLVALRSAVCAASK